MAPINHVFTSPQSDVTDTALVRPSNWNATHLYTLQDAVSLAGNTAGVLANISSGTLILAGGNNITLSQNGNSVTVSGVATAAQSEQTQSRFNLTVGGNTAGALALISSGVLTLAGGNNVTLSQAGNAVTVSGVATVAQTVQTQSRFNVTLGGNTAGALALVSSGVLTWAGGNNVTLSQAGNAVTVSAANTVAQTEQTQSRFNLTLGGNTSGALALVSSGVMTLAGGNNITLSQAGNVVTISGAVTVAQTVQTQNIVNVTLAGNTAGALAHISSGTMTLAGGDNITLSQAGNAVTVIGAAAGTGGGGAPIATTVQSVASANSVGTVTRYAAEDHQHAGLYQISVGGNTAGATSAGAGSLVLAGGPNITLSGATAGGGMTLSVSAAAAGGGVTPAVRFVEVNGPAGGLVTSLGLRNASLSCRPLIQPFPVIGSLAANTVQFIAGRSAGTSLVATVCVGFYTAANGTSLALLSSTSNGISLTNSTQYSGTRMYVITGLGAFTLTQGRYWMGLLVAGTGTNHFDLALMGAANVPTLVGSVFAGADSTAATATSNLLVPFAGVYSAVSSSLPANIGASDMWGGSGASQHQAYYAAIREA